MTKVTAVSTKHKLFILSQLMHGVWSSSCKSFINKTMKAKISILYKLVTGDHINTQGSPVSHIVHKAADAHAWGNISFFTGGALSLGITFW